jgi:hypothetical protein
MPLTEASVICPEIIQKTRNDAESEKVIHGAWPESLSASWMGSQRT